MITCVCSFVHWRTSLVFVIIMQVVCNQCSLSVFDYVFYKSRDAEWIILVWEMMLNDLILKLFWKSINQFESFLRKWLSLFFFYIAPICLSTTILFASAMDLLRSRPKLRPPRLRAGLFLRSSGATLLAVILRQNCGHRDQWAVSLRHTFEQVAQLWWKCNSLLLWVKLSRARLPFQACRRTYGGLQVSLPERISFWFVCSAPSVEYTAAHSFRWLYTEWKHHC